MKKQLLLFYMCLSIITQGQTTADSIKSKPVKFKNSIGIEITGIPLHIYYERQLLAKKNHELSAFGGVFLTNLLGLPGLSLGLNNRWRTNKNLGLYSTFKLDAINFNFPTYVFNTPWIKQHYYTFNMLSANISFGASLKKGRWEFILPSPCLMYSLVTYHNGEDESFAPVSAVSVVTKINYRF